MDESIQLMHQYILDRHPFKGGLDQRSPIEIPDAGRKQLARLYRHFRFKKGVELGVEQGLYTEVLCKCNPQAKVYAVDAWKAYKGYRDHVTQAKLDGFFEDTNRRLESLGNYELVRKFSMDAVKDFKDGELDFVYIDANHELPFIINDIIEWSKKVRIGGIVSGHDYRKSKRFDTRNHVVYAVDCYTASYRIKPWFLLGSKEKREGEVRDDARSWFWIKQY